MLLHECEINGLENTAVWEQYAKEEGRDCYTPDMPDDWEKCTTPAIAWAIGSKGENFPKHVGLPLDSGKVRYYMLEVHFDNPSMKRTKDTSGLRLKYTRNLRKNDGGIIATGISPHYLHVIPPGQKEYKSVGYCSTDCTREIFPKDGINVVSVLLHSHLAGRKLKLRHLRGGNELAPLVQDDHYDFNYQQSRSLTHEIKVLPGDSMITECTYSTVDRKKPTLGGYATSEEMCLAFILYYPKTELAGCYSMPPVRYFFEALGVQEFYNTTWTELEDKILRTSSETSTTPPTVRTSLFTYKPGDENSPEANARAILAIQNAKAYTIDGEVAGGATPFEKLIIKEPMEFQNKTFMAHLENMPYKEVLLTKKMEEYFHTGLHLTFCRKRDDTLAIRENVERFPNFTTFLQQPQTQCSYRNRVTYSSSQSLPINLPLILVPIISVLSSIKLNVIYF
ncbi:Copper type II ascorbate-dependent monooxygenase, C-terminal domain [Popillia japonica]|uniref:Copper type II ascorbate-dependent monooxygenase, C-terminal domain n=1 Tax=Popillia japonica TaxID=7064 RepID=A0AAW1MHE2_POPJA